MLRGWTDAVEAALAAGGEPNRAAALAARYAEAFPQATARLWRGRGARDIDRMRRLAGGELDRPLGRDARLYRLAGDRRARCGSRSTSSAARCRCPTRSRRSRTSASACSPKCRPSSAARSRARSTTSASACRGDDAEPLLARAAPIELAIDAVINARAEDDVFNRLIISTGLAAQETDWLRALYRYLRQTSIAFTIYTVVDALRGAPAVTRALVDLFRARHDPAFDRDRAAGGGQGGGRHPRGACGGRGDQRRPAAAALLGDHRCDPAHQRLHAGRGRCASPSSSTRRSCQACPSRCRGARSSSIRAASRASTCAPARSRAAGCAGPTGATTSAPKVLGLMKAQRVKNAVIVPTGAKGGFYPKRLPDPGDRPRRLGRRGRESYKLFVRSLLSITDNIVGDKVVHPAGVVIHDGEDPYFVVAADKGTATFSDTANAIAEESISGSATPSPAAARKATTTRRWASPRKGAWLSVQRHFLEMGVDVQKDPVRVAGCGDMSGDVFGNGMLLSKSIQLVAAFDHRHIFIDPNPDAAASWKERRRMFDLPRSSWADYNTKLISKGGGVFPRTQKSIPLSREARAALGIEVTALDPESLINAILKAPVDLLWFGGIGTYIKSSLETHQQVGDPANDALRVSGEDVRAKVIGEGANLGVTQAGRIEFALHGGRINTDFIDNSAGVDCSDNEVNIKIALEAAKRAGSSARRAASKCSRR
jgi:glutamate dehydrogenase